jgi:hypothetical protein
MNRRLLPCLLVAVACSLASSCSESALNSAPPASNDEKVLLELDYFEPMYKIDDAGRVTRLRMTNRQLPAPVLAQIGTLTALLNLELAGSSVTDADLIHLKDLQELRTIGLTGTAISDAGLVHLEKLESLRWIWLPKKTVTKEGAARLKASRPGITVYLP